LSKLKIVIVSLFALLLAIPALAGTITTTYGGNDLTGSGNGFTTSVQGATIIDFEGGAPSYFSGNFAVVSGSVSGKYAAPTGDNSKYISTPNPGNGSTGSYTISLPTLANYFGLYWGSIDTYNTIAFYDKNGGLIQSFSGSQFSQAQSRYVNFFSSVPIAKIVLSSSQFALEADNMAYAMTPEPTSMLLLGSGITGIAGLSRLRRRKKA